MVSELNPPTYFGICDHFIHGLRSLAVAVGKSSLFFLVVLSALSRGYLTPWPCPLVGPDSTKDPALDSRLAVHWSSVVNCSDISVREAALTMPVGRGASNNAIAHTHSPLLDLAILPCLSEFVCAKILPLH